MSDERKRKRERGRGDEPLSYIGLPGLLGRPLHLINRAAYGAANDHSSEVPRNS